MATLDQTATGISIADVFRKVGEPVLSIDTAW
jgi:hypothetical protein